MYASIRLALATAIAAVILSTPADVQASDRKATPGSACMPYGTLTTWEDLKYRPSGVYNQSAANKHVLCWVMQDDESEWDVGNPATVSLLFKAQIPTPIICTLTVGSSLTTGAVLYTQEITLQPNEVGQLNFSNVVGDGGGFYAWNPVSVNCRMPPKTTLTRILVNETGVTNTPPL